MFEIEVMTKNQIRHVKPKVPYAIISIADLSEDFVPMPVQDENLVGSLQIAFGDIYAKASKSYYKLFDRYDARKIWDFVESVEDKIKLLLVHCDGGTSRSPAVAAAISKVYTGHCSIYFDLYSPNAHVYSTMLREFCNVNENEDITIPVKPFKKFFPIYN